MTTTGMEEINFTSKRVLGVVDWRDRLFAKVIAEARALAAKTFNLGGVFATQMDISADGNDKFKLSPKSDATDGDGHLFTPDAELGEGVQFENANTIVYSVGLHFAQRPRGYQRNLRTGYPEIPAVEDTIGNQGTPNSVTDDGDGTMTIVVDSVCEAGVSHAGRKVVVYKTQPGIEATSEAEVIEELTVTWDGVNNRVLTTGNFGQGASPSTTAADYVAVLLGPTVRRGTDLSVEAGYAFIGTVTGAGAGAPPTVFSMTGQNVINTTLSDFNEVTRIDTHGHMKVSVVADVSDAGENQIDVRDSSNNVVWLVDEAGNEEVFGTLTAHGDEVVEGALTVNGALTVGGDALIGDSITDAHTVNGTWTHKVGGSTVFEIDGTTGESTFSVPATFDAAAIFTDSIVVTGTAEFDDAVIFNTGATVEFVDTVLFDADVSASNVGISNSGSLTKTRNSATASADPDTDSGIFLTELNTSNGAISPPLWFMHSAADASRDGVGIYSKRVAEDDVDLYIGSVHDSGAMTELFQFDTSAGDISVTGGFKPLADPATTTAVFDRLVKRNVPKASAYVQIDNSSSVTLLDGFNIDSVSDDGLAAFGTFSVTWKQGFLNTSYQVIATLEQNEAVPANTFAIPIAANAGTATKTTDKCFFNIRDNTGTRNYDGVADLSKPIFVSIFAFGRQS